MEEKNYSINWLSLFIKVTVFVIVVLLAIWLVSKILRRDKGLSFEENNKLFINASVEYFSKNLPEEGKTMAVTLNQLISWDYLDELKDEEGKVCDKKNSKSKIELVDNYYSIKSVFVCGNKSETTYTKLGNEECSDCDVVVENLEIKKKVENKENTNENNNIVTESSKGPSITPENITNNSSNNNVVTKEENNTPNEIVLYEYVKEVDRYSEWYTGKVTGNNIENSTKKVSYSKFCQIKNSNKCITDKTENASKYSGYKKTKTWNEIIDIYRYKITIEEYKYSNATSLEGYTKTGNTKIASN